MDGTVGLSLQVAAASPTASGRLKLQDGEILSLRVGESVGKNRYSITVRGARLTVRSNVSLPEGTLLHAKVVFSGRRIELKILEQATTAAPRLGRGLSSPLTAPDRAAANRDPAALLIQAMQRTGLPVTTASMNAITAMLPPERRSNPAFLRLAAVLFDKHLHLDPERLEELYLTINERPRGDAGGGAESRQGTSGGGGGRNPQHGAAGPPPSASAQEDDASASERAPAAGAEPTLALGLRQQLSARGLESIGWPALINHAVGEHESWVIVPFSLSSATTTVEGTLRLLIAPPVPRRVSSGSRLSVARAVVVVPEVGAFEIKGAPARIVAVHAASDAMYGRIAALLPELREKLRNLGVEIDDTNNGGAVFDGFSAETVEIRGVDASA